MSRPNKSEVEFFFNSQADLYRTRLNRWPWKWLRNKEASTIQRLLPDIQEKTTLDACSGTGYYAYLLNDLGAKSCLCIDLSPKMLSQIRHPNIQTWAGDFSNFSSHIPFDLIVCAGGLEFFEKPISFFRKSHQLCSQSGHLVILYPPKNFFGRFYKLYHASHGVKIHLFSLNDLSKMAAKTSWKMKKTCRSHLFANVVVYEKI